MRLYNVVVGALMIATMSIGVTSFISTGVNEYGVADNIDQSGLQKLEKVENATSITTRATDRASNVESKSNYFNLPGVVKTGKLFFDAFGLWSSFISIIAEITGLNNAPGNWPVLLATGSLGVVGSMIFVKRYF